jgi:hypothetical protein
MTPPDRPRCVDCRHFVPSHVYEGKGVCTHLMSGPRPPRDDLVRDLYVLKDICCCILYKSDAADELYC